MSSVLTFLAEWSAIVVLVACSGLFSGLTLGLLSLDVSQLEIVIAAGNPRDAGYAKKIYPIRKKGNLLLCTLLLGNVMVNAALSILLADKTGGTLGFISSSALIVIFGEIIPQASCSRYGLAIGARTVILVKFFIACLFVLAWPISKCLDWALGGEEPVTYTKRELVKLLTIQVEEGKISSFENQYMSGALSFNQKTITDFMTPLEKVFMLEIDTILNYETLQNILDRGHSRVPVYEKSRENILGLLLVKDLILVNPEELISLRTVIGFYSRKIPRIFPSEKPQSLLNLFRSTQTHLAIVWDVFEEEGKDPFYKAVGIVTLEDVIEELIQLDIVDETDFYVDSRSLERVVRTGTEGEIEFRKYLTERRKKKQGLPDGQKKAVLAFLRSNCRAFSSDYVSESVLKTLIAQATVENLEPPKEGEKEMYVYERAKRTPIFTLVLQGKLKILSGTDQFISEAGPFTTLGLDALTSITFAPDFSAVVVEPVQLMRISRQTYVAALKASEAQRPPLIVAPHTHSSPTARGPSAGRGGDSRRGSDDRAYQLLEVDVQMRPRSKSEGQRSDDVESP